MPSGVAIGVGTGVAAAVILAAWHGLSYYEVDVKCEKPKYTVIRTLGSKKNWLGRPRPAVEIRRYAPILVAEVALEGMEMREALGSGFRQIAGFIFGKNVAPGSDTSTKVAMTSPVALEASPPVVNQKIAMTAPVAAEAISANEYKVSFIMPSAYTKETLPTPINENVKIKEVGSRTMAALTWGGKSPSAAVMGAKEAELKAVLETAGLTPIGSVNLWQYHPPFSPAWMRRNEVLFEVEEDAAAAVSTF